MAGKTVRRLAGNGSGPSLVDVVTSLKHSISGSVIAKTICKATTEEIKAPKRKHLNILVNYTFEPRLSIPDFTDYIINRSHNSNWVVSFKALITIHHLMNYGNERFSQYLASNNCLLSSPRPIDTNRIDAHTMFAFIRHYSKYLDSRASSYRDVAFDFCNLKKKKDTHNVRTMTQAKLMKTLPSLEAQIDALLAFDASSSELMNSVILSAYFLLYKDLIRLYAVYNEAMINIIENFFTMSKKDCQDSLRVYKEFLRRMNQVNLFVKVAEACDQLKMDEGFGIQAQIFKPVPPSVYEALEQHLFYLLGKKVGDGTSKSTLTNSIEVSAVKLDNNNDSISLNQQRLIEEERQRLEVFVSEARRRQERDESASSARSNSTGDLIGMMPDSELMFTLKEKEPVSFSALEDVFSTPSTNTFCQPNHMKSSLSSYALSPNNTAGQTNIQSRPFSQFLSQPPNAYQPNNTAQISLLNQPQTNPFAQNSLNQFSSQWPPTFQEKTNQNPTANSIQTVSTSSKSDLLNSRLAELAGNLTVARPPVTTVNWETGKRILAMPTSNVLSQTTSSTYNPWSNSSSYHPTSSMCNANSLNPFL